MGEILHVHISELQGAIPDVPLSSGVDYAALVAGDDDPVFLTLPLMAAGAVSRNKRRYGAEEVQALVEQINTNRPGGILGHMSAAERSTRFDLPSLMWVGATVKDGTALAKAYIPRYAENVREYVLKSKARRAKIATSIYGTADMDGEQVRNLQIESIDLVDPARAGLAVAVAEPTITRETLENEEGDMPDNQEWIAELRGQREQIQEQLDTVRTQISELQNRVSVLEQHEATVTAIREMIPEGDLVQNIREMQVAVNEFMESQRVAAIAEAVTAALGDIAQNERGAALIREMVGPVDSPEAAAARVAELLGKDSVQYALKSIVGEMGGPGAIVTGNGNNGSGNHIDDSPEALQAARRQWGF